MGYPVVHFEITGRDGAALRSFYADLFDWRTAADNPMGYGVVDRDENLSAEGVGIGGGIAQGPEGYPGHVTVYVEVPDVEAALAKAEDLGGARMMGPSRSWRTWRSACSPTRRATSSASCDRPGRPDRADDGSARGRGV